VTASLETSDAPVDVGEGKQALAKGAISLSGVLFVSIATMAPGAGLAYSIMTGSEFAGGALPLAVVGATIGCVLVAVGIALSPQLLNNAEMAMPAAVYGIIAPLIALAFVFTVRRLDPGYRAVTSAQVS